MAFRSESGPAVSVEPTRWRYLPGGKVKHALEYPEATAAGCGARPPSYAAADWRGTGSQNEYEECARRPACRRCVALGFKP